MLTRSRSPDIALNNVICVSGMGGIGKTSLVKKYARTKVYAEYYDSNVLWMDAENLESVRNSFGRLAASPPAVPGIETRPSEVITASVYEALKTLRKPPLIIFDNAENFSVVKQFLPKLRNSEDPYILVTTRYDDFTGLTRNELRLQPLKTDESVQLIREQLPHCSVQAAAQLADRLDGFPLILQQALSYIKATFIESDDCILKYLDELECSSRALLDDRTFQNMDGLYTETAWTVCSMTLTKIRTFCKPAYDLIKQLGVLSPETSWKFLNTLLNSEMESELKILAKHSMITLHKGGAVVISTHRIVQQVVRRSLAPDDEKAVVREIARRLGLLIRSCDHKDIGNEIISQTLNLMRMQLLSPELLEIGLDYLDERLGWACTSEICEGLIKQRCNKSLPERQEILMAEFRTIDPSKCLKYIHALSVSNQLFGPSNRVSAYILCSMAKVCLTSGKLETALKLIREACDCLGEAQNLLNEICRLREVRLLTEMEHNNNALVLARSTYANCLVVFGHEYFESLSFSGGATRSTLQHIMKVCKDGINCFYDCRSYGDRHYVELIRERQRNEARADELLQRSRTPRGAEQRRSESFWSQKILIYVPVANIFIFAIVMV